MSTDEMETTFTIEATDRQTVHIFTNDAVWQRKIEGLGIVANREDMYGKFYQVSLADFNFGIKRKRQLSDEQRGAMAKRLQGFRSDTTGKNQR